MPAQTGKISEDITRNGANSAHFLGTWFAFFMAAVVQLYYVHCTCLLKLPRAVGRDEIGRVTGLEAVVLSECVKGGAGNEAVWGVVHHHAACADWVAHALRTCHGSAF